MGFEYKLVAPDKTHCAKGHRYTPETERRYKKHTPYGNYIYRNCKVCAREYQERRKKRLAETKQPRETKKGVRPPPDELLRMSATRTWVELGQIYGVSDVAVRKWAKAYKIMPEDLAAPQPKVKNADVHGPERRLRGILSSGMGESLWPLSGD